MSSIKNILAHDVEPCATSLRLHKNDLADARETLQSRWPVRSEEPLISILEVNRDTILALIESSSRILDILLTPAEEHHCARPEDCGHPRCRDEHDRLNRIGAAVLDPWDHPKVNLYPSEREPARDCTSLDGGS